MHITTTTYLYSRNIIVLLPLSDNKTKLASGDSIKTYYYAQVKNKMFHILATLLLPAQCVVHATLHKRKVCFPVVFRKVKSENKSFQHRTWNSLLLYCYLLLYSLTAVKVHNSDIPQNKEPHMKLQCAGECKIKDPVWNERA